MEVSEDKMRVNFFISFMTWCSTNRFDYDATFLISTSQVEQKKDISDGNILIEI
jgi:hypothetical protein